MGFQLPAIAKASRRLRADIEMVVRAFPRFHRYELGTDIRRQMRKVQTLVTRAWHDQDLDQRAHWVSRLVGEVDVLKEDLQAAKDVHAFKNFRQFELVYRQVEEVGRQAGGWHRQFKHPKGQNPAGRRAVPERAQILSTRATSQGVNV